MINDVDLIEGDIRDANAMDEATNGVDCVIHLAFVNGTEYFYSAPQLVLDVGVRGMLNVLDACLSNGVKELFLASSSEVYQEPPSVPTDETVPLVIPDIHNPRYSYGAGKIISEAMAINYGRKSFERVVVFRPHNIYGPDMGWEHVIPQFVLRTMDLIEKHPEGPLPFEVQGDGTQSRSFVHIEDCTRAVMHLVERGTHLEIYNVGNPEELAVSEVARRVAAHFGREIQLVPGPGADGGTSRRCPDIGKLVALGFQPRIAFDQGLPPTIDWYAANRHLAGARANR